MNYEVLGLKEYIKGTKTGDFSFPSHVKADEHVLGGWNFETLD
jgi:hypothetical protein